MNAASLAVLAGCLVMMVAGALAQGM